MFREKTFVVVGAGASTEINIPAGGQLKQRIASSLDISFDDFGLKLQCGDRLIYQALKLTVDGQTINSYLREARHIRDAMPLALSIDNFVDTQPLNEKVELLAKLAIVRTITEAEKQSSIYFDSFSGERTIDFAQLNDTWLSSFFKLLAENCRLEDLKERLKSLVLVIFNYDRSVEHFLFHALQVYYRISAEAAAELINSMQIYHPYGTAGKLEWQNAGISNLYGQEPHPAQLLRLATQIRTFTEGIDQESTYIDEIHQGLRDSGIVVFLGFAFHPLNMKLLTPIDQDLEHTVDMKCFATAFGQSIADVPVIEEQIRGLLPRANMICEVNEKLKCSTLLQHYWKSLALS